MSASPMIQSFFDAATGTWVYVVYAQVGGQCAVIDSVLGYEPKSGKTNTNLADDVIAYIRTHNLSVEWIVETHAHADHITAAQYIQQQLGGRIGIGGRITQVQSTFKKVFNLNDTQCSATGLEFDTLFVDYACFSIGDLTVQVLPVPGHTAACVAYQIEGHIWVGDTLFAPDVGTARCDFPGGDAAALYHSITTQLYSQPDDTVLHLCHDYPPSTRTHTISSTTVAEQKSANIHINAGTSLDTFVAMRTARDSGLAMPVLLLPSIQLNIRAGQPPQAESNGKVYLKIPFNVL